MVAQRNKVQEWQQVAEMALVVAYTFVPAPHTIVKGKQKYHAVGVIQNFSHTITYSSPISASCIYVHLCR